MSKQNRAPGALRPGEQPEHLDELTRRLLSHDPKLQENGAFIYRRIASTESRHDALAQVIRIWRFTESSSERKRIDAALRRIGTKVVNDLHAILKGAEMPANPLCTMWLLINIGPCSQAEEATLDQVTRHPRAKEAVRDFARLALDELHKRQRETDARRTPDEPNSCNAPKPRDQLAQRLLAQDLATQEAGILIYRRIATAETRCDALDQLVHAWRFAESTAQREHISGVIQRIGQNALDDLRTALARPDLPPHPVTAMILLVDSGGWGDAEAAAVEKVAQHPHADEVVRQFAHQTLREIRARRQRSGS